MASKPSRRKLYPETIPQVRELAALGMTLSSIASILGIHRRTLDEWRATEPDLDDAIQKGNREGEAALIKRLHAAALDGDTHAAIWLLTHSPNWRDTWSDGAAVRRELNRHTGRFVAALKAANLPQEMVRNILLHCVAQGMGVPEHEQQQ